MDINKTFKNICRWWQIIRYDD